MIHNLIKMPFTKYKRFNSDLVFVMLLVCVLNRRGEI